MHHPTDRITHTTAFFNTSRCYTSSGVLAGMRNSSMGPPHGGSIWRPIAPWVNAPTTELHLAPRSMVAYGWMLLVLCRVGVIGTKMPYFSANCFGLRLPASQGCVGIMLISRYPWLASFSRLQDDVRFPSTVKSLYQVSMKGDMFLN